MDTTRANVFFIQVQSDSHKTHYNISNVESLLFGIAGSEVTTKLRIALNTNQFSKPV